MSAPQKFPDLPAALEAYRAGTCRRWVEVDGWQIDLVQAAEPSKVARPGATEPVFVGGVPVIELQTDQQLPYGCDAMFVVPFTFDDPHDRAMYDRNVALCIAAEMSQAVEVLPPLAEPAIAAPPVECCRACGRPLIGVVP